MENKSHQNGQIMTNSQAPLRERRMNNHKLFVNAQVKPQSMRIAHCIGRHDKLVSWSCLEIFERTS
jgi:hypothetical protein